MPADDAVVNRPETIWDLLERRVATAPERELVEFGNGMRLTVAAVHRRSLEIARGLAAVVGPGDRVATCLHPGPDLVCSIFALARLGAAEVPLSVDRMLAGELRLVLDIGIRVLLTDGALLESRPDLASIAAIADHIVLVGDPATGRPISLDSLVSDPSAMPARRPRPADPALIITTSGSTGRPKAAVLPHFAGVRHARRVSLAMRYSRDDVLFNAFPWNHINVRHAALLPALMTGGRLVARERFRASEFWLTCRDEGVTAFNFMGALAAILERRAPSDDDRDHRVRRAYGGPAPAPLVRRFHEHFGVTLLEAYACTELGDVAVSTMDTRRPGSAGRIVPEYDVRILDLDGQDVPAGCEGEIAVRPRHRYIAFRGYAAGSGSPSPWRDGWFRPGDRGYLDDDGYLYFAGRTTDVVRRRGHTVSAWEVERTISELPGVDEVAVVGVPADLTEEELLAVVATTTATVDATAVRRWCEASLPRHAVPRYVRITTALPHNRNGKIVKAGLRSVGLAPETRDFGDRTVSVPR